MCFGPVTLHLTTQRWKVHILRQTLISENTSTTNKKQKPIGNYTSRIIKCYPIKTISKKKSTDTNTFNNKQPFKIYIHMPDSTCYIFPIKYVHVTYGNLPLFSSHTISLWCPVTWRLPSMPKLASLRWSRGAPSDVVGKARTSRQRSTPVVRIGVGNRSTSKIFGVRKFREKNKTQPKMLIGLSRKCIWFLKKGGFQNRFQCVWMCLVYLWRTQQNGDFFNNLRAFLVREPNGAPSINALSSLDLGPF